MGTSGSGGLQHPAPLSLAVALLCVLVTLGCWFSHPLSFFVGPWALASDPEPVRTEAHAPAKAEPLPPEATEGASEEQRAAYRQLAEGLGLDHQPPAPTSTKRREAYGHLLDTFVERGTLTGGQADSLRERMSRLPLRSDAFIDLSEAIDNQTENGVMAASDMKDIRDEVAKAGSGLSPGERTELTARLAKLHTASDSLAYRAWGDHPMPWYLLPSGAWSSPIQWIASAFVHLRWSTALFTISLLWNFSRLIEGNLGTRRFAIIFGTGLLGTGCIQMLAGLSLPVVVPTYGATQLVSFLAGAVWAWLALVHDDSSPGFSASSADASTVRRMVLVWMAAGLVLRWLDDLPLVAVLLGGIASPLAGYAFAKVVAGPWGLLPGQPTSSMGGIPAAPAPVQDHPPALAVVPADARPSGPPTRPAGGTSGSRQSNADRMRLASAIDAFRGEVDQGAIAPAFRTYAMIRSRWPEWRGDFPPMQRLIDGLGQLGAHADRLVVARDCIAWHPGLAHEARLHAAEVLILHQGDPRAGLELLDGIANWALRPSQRRQVAELRQQAQDRIDGDSRLAT